MDTRVTAQLLRQGFRRVGAPLHVEDYYGRGIGSAASAAVASGGRHSDRLRGSSRARSRQTA
ncbi:MAG: hypothetical protein JKY65_15675 [Planctomycetes bacterium]|nr:hypothetical protein [Planctomycetota bacterium]